jgi:hypothetical protein
MEKRMSLFRKCSETPNRPKTEPATIAIDLFTLTFRYEQEEVQVGAAQRSKTTDHGNLTYYE